MLSNITKPKHKRLSSSTGKGAETERESGGGGVDAAVVTLESLGKRLSWVRLGGAGGSEAKSPTQTSLSKPKPQPTHLEHPFEPSSSDSHGGRPRTTSQSFLDRQAGRLLFGVTGCKDGINPKPHSPYLRSTLPSHATKKASSTRSSTPPRRLGVHPSALVVSPKGQAHTGAQNNTSAPASPSSATGSGGEENERKRESAIRGLRRSVWEMFEEGKTR